MNTDFSALCDRVDQSSATVLQNLSQIEASVRELQGEVAKMPFFARGFVSGEVKKSTGQDLPAWAQALDSLIATIREAQAATGRVRAAGAVGDADRSIVLQAGQRVQAEQPRLSALVAMMEKAPTRINAIPGAMLPADRREELLGAIGRQVEALNGALAAMPELAASLTALGGEAA